MKWIRYVAVAAVTLAGLGVARAEDWKPVGEFGYFGVGKAMEIEKGHLYWVGEFGGTFLSDKKAGLFDHAGVRCPGFNDLDVNQKKGRAAGYCIVSDNAGDQAFLSWNCEGDTKQCKGTFNYTGGTGKFEKISGSNTFAAAIAVHWKDGMVSGAATWNR
ncbi:MAG: hypothetical protein ACM3JG_20130 [Thiohalocapsa sp.]